MRTLKFQFEFKGEGENATGPVSGYKQHIWTAGPGPQGRVVRVVAYLEAEADAKTWLFLERTAVTKPGADQALVYFHDPRWIRGMGSPLQSIWSHYLPYPVPADLAHRAGCELSWELDAPHNVLRCATEATGSWVVAGELTCIVDDCD